MNSRALPSRDDIWPIVRAFAGRCLDAGEPVFTLDRAIPNTIEEVGERHLLRQSASPRAQGPSRIRAGQVERAWSDLLEHGSPPDPGARGLCPRAALRRRARAPRGPDRRSAAPPFFPSPVDYRDAARRATAALEPALSASADYHEGGIRLVLHRGPPHPPHLTDGPEPPSPSRTSPLHRARPLMSVAELRALLEGRRG